MKLVIELLQPNGVPGARVNVKLEDLEQFGLGIEQLDQTIPLNEPVIATHVRLRGVNDGDTD